MSLVIFAEGSEHRPGSSRRNGTPFQELWETLSSKCGRTEKPRVIGFSKNDIVTMGSRVLGDDVNFTFGLEQRDTISHKLPKRKFVEGKNGFLELGLDRLIRDEDNKIRKEDRQDHITQLVIAFDFEPIYDSFTKRCRRAERMLVIDCLRRSPYIPEHLQQAAEVLWQFYRDKHLAKQPPRQEDDPRFAIELILMNPCFESMMLADEAAIFRVLHPAAKSRSDVGWPPFKRAGRKDVDGFFTGVCKSAPRPLKMQLQDPDCYDKHIWAEYILRNIPDDSTIWEHPISSRLRMNLQGRQRA